MRGKYTHIDKDILIKAYEDNNRSMRAAAKVLGTSEKTIMRRMREYGIKWDEKPFYHCNENFFNDINEKSAYWLGFLATDGNVYKHNYTYTVSLRLATKDKNHLIKFKSDISSESPINDYILKNKGIAFKKEKYFSSEIRLSSKKMFDRLSDFNIVPAKTHIYKFPEKLKDHTDVRHFIRGCIDGDGWWRPHKNNKSKIYNNLRVGMCGTPNFVKEVFDFLRLKLDIKTGNYFIRKSLKTADFEFCAKDDVRKIYDYLYNNSTVYLERKKEIIDEFYSSNTLSNS